MNRHRVVERKVRWGIIGLGNIGRHAIVPAIRNAENSELVAIASRDSERARKLADELQVPLAFASYEELLRADIDAVYIGLPNGLHEEWTIACANAGKHILCEKALTFTEASAKRMADACEGNGVLLQEAFMYRHHPQWHVVHQIIREGKLGRVVSLTMMLSGNLEKSNPADHRWSATLGGGALFDVTCYGIDISRYMLGEEPVSVSATADLTTPDGVDRSTVVTMMFPGGVIAVAIGSLASHGNQFAKIIGTDGTLDIPRPVIPNRDPAPLILRRDGHPEETITASGADHFQKQVENFSRAIATSDKPCFPGEDGLGNCRVYEAVVKSFRSGHKILLPPATREIV
ncbi:Gfo/Idh/MocA family oxidoreductase [Candidatus Sumerlaeota bacterium]|nr:Gfo/Idh/MocA family oxidoreductase [Candidatus Sumerlaeota bacterium]